MFIPSNKLRKLDQLHQCTRDDVVDGHHINAHLLVQRRRQQTLYEPVMKATRAVVAMMALETADCPELETPCMGPETTTSSPHSRHHIYAFLCSKRDGSRPKQEPVVKDTSAESAVWGLRLIAAFITSFLAQKTTKATHLCRLHIYALLWSKRDGRIPKQEPVAKGTDRAVWCLRQMALTTSRIIRRIFDAGQVVLKVTSHCMFQAP